VAVHQHELDRRLALARDAVQVIGVELRPERLRPEGGKPLPGLLGGERPQPA